MADPKAASSFPVALEVYCRMTRASVTSWGRTVAHNAAVGGSATSRHLEWVAADVVYDDKHPSGLQLTVRQSLAEAMGLHRLVEGDHDHLSVVAADGRY